MLDPLTSLSLAANIADLITFTCSVIKTGRELASNGSTADNARLQAVAESTKNLCNILAKQHQEDYAKYKRDLKIWEQEEKEAANPKPRPLLPSDSSDNESDDDSEPDHNSHRSQRSSSYDSSIDDESDFAPLRAPRPEEVNLENPLIDKASMLADDVIAGLQKLSLQPTQRKRKRDTVLPTLKTVIKIPTLRKWQRQLEAIQQPLTLHLAGLQ